MVFFENNIFNFLHEKIKEPDDSDCHIFYLLSVKEQKQNPDIITSQAKVSSAKTSSRLSFVSRLRAKMHRNSRPALKAPQNYSNGLDVEGDLEEGGKVSRGHHVVPWWLMVDPPELATPSNKVN